MVRHIVAVLWGIGFCIAIGISVTADMVDLEGGQGGSVYMLGMYLALAVLLLGCPLCIVDNRLVSRYSKDKKSIQLQEKLKEKEQELSILEYQKRLELERKDIELQRRDLALQAKEIELKQLGKVRQELTEDDIKVSKEKHFCLVHKGEIKGYSYICPECSAYYCLNCIEALKDLDNECWSCETAIDASRPTLKEEMPISDEVHVGDVPKMPKTNFCKYCGNSLPKGTNNCPKCGKELK